MFSVDALRAHALTLGFDLCGVAPVQQVARLDYLREWVAKGYAGDLHYVTRSADARIEPERVLPGARSAIVTGTIYHTDAPLSRDREMPGAAHIARYAWGEDYHEVLGRRQHLLIGWLKEHADGAFDAVGYVDTGPVQEKALAAAAGLGWIGKHTCLINQELGSWLFLSVILTTLDLPAGNAGARSLRDLHAVPRRLSHQRDRRALRRRCDALPVLHHDRVARGHRARATRVGGLAGVRLRPLPGRVPLEHRRRGDRGPGVGGAAALASRRRSPSCGVPPTSDLQVAIRHSPMYRTKVWRIRRNLALAIAASGDA